MIKRIITLSYILLPMILLIGFWAAVVESYKYLGFLRKHLFIEIDWFFYLGVILGIILVLGFDRVSQSKYSKVWESLYHKLFFYNLFLLPVLVFLMRYFSVVEGQKGLNFVFVTYHIQPGNLIYVFQFSFLTLFINLLLSLRSRRS